MSPWSPLAGPRRKMDLKIDADADLMGVDAQRLSNLAAAAVHQFAKMVGHGGGRQCRQGNAQNFRQASEAVVAGQRAALFPCRYGGDADAQMIGQFILRHAFVLAELAKTLTETFGFDVEQGFVQGGESRRHGKIHFTHINKLRGTFGCWRSICNGRQGGATFLTAGLGQFSDITYFS